MSRWENLEENTYYGIFIRKYIKEVLLNDILNKVILKWSN